MSTNRYPLLWRWLHWVIAALVIILLAIGLWMTARSGANLWDDLTDSLYAWHKAIGFSVLLLMILRVLVRLTFKKPTPANLSPTLRRIARIVHELLYALLFAVPLLGWAGVTAWPALGIFLGFQLPAMPNVGTDESFAKQILDVHGMLAYALGILVALHISAAFKHLFIDKNDVFDRIKL